MEENRDNFHSETSVKYALYCRVSTHTQTNDNQKVRLLQYAEDRKISFDLYEEVESSRKTRPVKQDLLSKLRQGQYAAVVVFKLDRFARSFTELILDVQELLDKGVGFISVSDNLDFTTASGKLHFQILSAFAEFERELIRERTIEGLKRAKSKGKKLGRPFGSKDGKKRRRSGYLLREAGKRKKKDETQGKYLPLENYVN
jgi:putative DNA-invertase from lambdoid prophage Rac